MVEEKDKFTLEGGKIRTGEPDYRVFVFGIEITADVSSVITTWSFADSNATVEVANAREKYIVTRDNLDGEWREDEAVKEWIYNKKKKFTIEGATGGIENVYDLHEDECIFNCGDPVRVYLKDPFSKQWYRGFTGYVTPVTDSYDAAFEKYTITLHCEDTKRWIKATRLVWGAWGKDGSPIKMATEEEMESAVNSVWQEIKPGFTLADYIIWLITGEGAQRNGKTLESISQKCGNFEKGKEWAVKTVKDLESAQNWLWENVLRIDEDQIAKEGATVHQNVPKICYDANDNIVDCDGEEVVSIVDDYSKWKDAGLYSVDGKVHLLLPEFFSSGAEWEGLLPHNIRENIGYRDEYQSRLSLLEDWIGRVNFFFYSLPNGDVICEFPQFDARPKDYGSANQSVIDPFRPDVSDYEIFRIDNSELEGWSITEDDSEIETMFLVGGSLTQYFQNPTEAAKVAGVVAFSFRPALVKRFGWKAREISAPLVVEKEGAQLYADAIRNKSYINARTMSVPTTPKFEAWPARPYKVVGRKVLGFCTSIRHTVVWNQQVRTNFDFGYLRTYNEAKGRWTTIGGEGISEGARMLDYSKLFSGTGE